MRKGLTSLSGAEAARWRLFRAQAEHEAWVTLCEVFPRLNQFSGPAGKNNGFRFYRDAAVVIVDSSGEKYRI